MLSDIFESIIFLALWLNAPTIKFAYDVILIGKLRNIASTVEVLPVPAFPSITIVETLADSSPKFSVINLIDSRTASDYFLFN